MLPFDAEFLRWMLSDGAGAALLQPAPAARGVSLRVDWIDIRSYAHEHATCMYAGAVKRPDGSMGPGWLDLPTFEAAGQEGALFLRQDVRQLDALIRLGVDGFFRLVDEGRLVAPEIRPTSSATTRRSSSARASSSCSRRRARRCPRRNGSPT